MSSANNGPRGLRRRHRDKLVGVPFVLNAGVPMVLSFDESVAEAGLLFPAKLSGAA
jgi:hypothetical protein